MKMMRLCSERLPSGDASECGVRVASKAFRSIWVTKRPTEDMEDSGGAVTTGQAKANYTFMPGEERGAWWYERGQKVEKVELRRD